MPTDKSDPVAVLRRCFTEQCMPDNSDEAIALAELERRQGREKRLEDLLHVLTNALIYEEGHERVAGLVEAARKEIENGNP